jgi:hypothetical protein
MSKKVIAFKVDPVDEQEVRKAVKEVLKTKGYKFYEKDRKNREEKTTKGEEV